jgi:hypothetical protein
MLYTVLFSTLTLTHQPVDNRYLLIAAFDSASGGFFFGHLTYIFIEIISKLYQFFGAYSSKMFSSHSDFVVSLSSDKLISTGSAGVSFLFSVSSLIPWSESL